MPTTDVSGDLPPVKQLRAALNDACRNDDQGLYVLLDGARIPKLWVMLRELKAPHLCLFRESPKENLTNVAPFLARCEIRGDLTFWLAIQETALEAALFFVSGAGVEEIYRHLRRFLLVLDAAGKENYLRFYDPRVIEPFLAASTEAEKRQFFGVVRCFMAHDAAASEAAGVIALRRWLAPAPVVADAPRPPSATSKFRLSKGHEAEFRRDAMARYDRRCAAFLRHRHAVALAGMPDAKLRDLIEEAKKLAPGMGLTRGREVTLVAELLALGLPPQLQARLMSIPLKDRSHAAKVLRDRLASERMPAPGTRERVHG